MGVAPPSVTEELLREAACFHAQQAMEKTFKALLAHRGQPLLRGTHDLEEPAVLCGKLRALPELSLEDLADANDYAILVRYDIETWPSQDETREVPVLAERVSAVIQRHLPPEVRP